MVSSLTSAYTHFQLRGLLLPAHPVHLLHSASQLIPQTRAPSSCSAQGWPCSTRNSDLSWIPPPLQLLSTAQAPTSCPLPPSTSARVTGLHGSCSLVLSQTLHTCLLAPALPRPGSCETLFPLLQAAPTRTVLGTQEAAGTGAESTETPSHPQTADIPG